MVKTPVTAFRLAPELLERIDRYADDLEEVAGVPVSRNAAVVRLLTDALDYAESRSGRVKRSTPRAARSSRP